MRPERDALEIQFHGCRLPGGVAERTPGTSFNPDSTLVLTLTWSALPSPRNDLASSAKMWTEPDHLEDAANRPSCFPSIPSGCCTRNFATRTRNRNCICSGSSSASPSMADNTWSARVEPTGAVALPGNWPIWPVPASIPLLIAILRCHPIRGRADPYNPTVPALHVNFYTSKASRGRPTRANACQLGGADSDWEAEYAAPVESHPRVRAYIKNQGLGLEVALSIRLDHAQILS